MLIRNFKFIDFDGVEREEEHMFHLNKAELFKYLTTEGDYTLDQKLERLKRERNGKKIMETLDEFIHISYGRKTEGGRGFEKSEKIWEDFKCTEAYSQLFVEIVTSGRKAAEFINAVIPKELADEVSKIIAENPEGIPDEMKDYLLNDSKG